MKRKYRLSLRVKLLVFAVILALITYGSSGFFIFILYDKIDNFLPFSQEIFTIVTLLLGVFWSGVLAYAAAGLITKPLLQLENAASRAAKGDISKEADISGSSDEISSLGLAFNTMLANLRSIVSNIEENFEATNSSVEKIKTAAAEAEIQVNNIALTIEEIAAGAENSSSAVLNAAKAVEESNKLAGEVQTKARCAYELFEDMQKSLDSAKVIIKSLIDSIQKLSEEQMNSLTEVNRLEKNAVKIEEIITLVGEIADQTNLLALNASIEAARAGEHGRGFAVVADEIRKLADQSAAAVNEISNLVTAIQQDVAQAVKRIQGQTDDARKEADKGVHASAAMEQVSASVEQVGEAVVQITELINEQRQKMEEIHEQSQEVAAISEETTAGTQQVSASIQQQNAMIQDICKIAVQLEEQAQKLNEQIRQFKIKKT